MFTKNPNQIDDNYLAVLKYNMACCFQKLGLIEACIKCLQDSINVLDRKIQAIFAKTNGSFSDKSYMAVGLKQQSVSTQNTP